ncbi:hypothetical protein [Chachezhania antarctica]|uniref:hypothetical protein n=1 Tax=Chachezhania antarctica TaxID=2340860 RepID=UPI000EAD0245|nr:hypothetical protein [Chachezhania antarctica]|tara:strand:+ start:2901 stop:3599 length:699 start_codon:yes stop_codon:yes gene_type:complete
MITARCHPALLPILPPPVPAAKTLPDWLREMPSEAPADLLDGEAVRTLKHCPPILDAMGAGVLVPLATDLTVENGEISWDWDPPVLPETLISRAPIGMHVPEQAKGAPFGLTDGMVVKFLNFWTFEVPEGYSLLFTHPLNRPDLPFRTLAGLVDCDGFRDGYVHFPALWPDPDWQGVLPAGTPVAQVVAVPREAQGLTILPMTEAQVAANRDVQEALQTRRGVYRKEHRHRS